MNIKPELRHLKGLNEGRRVRIAKLETMLEKEKPELPYQAELDAVLGAYSYKVVIATCDRLELAFSGHYTLEFLKGGILTISALDHATAFGRGERRLLEELSLAFTSCGDC